jgi:ketosteroid isomerase-like protein
MKKYLLFITILLSSTSFAQNKDEQAIRDILANQTKAWNKGDLNAFMVGYWENDSLVYIGKNGPTYGYATTLNNYKKNYPDTSHMGKLEFQLISVKPLNTNHYFVIGKWHLNRTVGDASGYFTLLFRKINGEWKAIADHSS